MVESTSSSEVDLLSTPLESLCVTSGDSAAAKGPSSKGKGKAQRGKGVNPIKAKARQRAIGQETHPVGQSSSAGDAIADYSLVPQHLPFSPSIDGPLLTLLFPSASLQHRALARIETFYESPIERYGKRYYSWEDVARQGITLCRGYVAFNFPIEAAKEWVESMRAHSTETGSEFLRVACNAEEAILLEYLQSINALQLDGTERAVEAKENQAAPSREGEAPLYLISALTNASSPASALSHERLHALFNLSASYCSSVKEYYSQTLAKKTRKIIEDDLRLKGYDERVWPDEWQAYLFEEGCGAEMEGFPGALRAARSTAAAVGEAKRKIWGDRVEEEMSEARRALAEVLKRECEMALSGVEIWSSS